MPCGKVAPMIRLIFAAVAGFLVLVVLSFGLLIVTDGRVSPVVAAGLAMAATVATVAWVLRRFEAKPGKESATAPVAAAPDSLSGSDSLFRAVLVAQIY